MIRAKNGNIIFKNQAELNIYCGKYLTARMDKVIEEARKNSTEKMLRMIIPVACTALYESHNFGEKRLAKFIKTYNTHLDCMDKKITDLEQYKDFCKDQGWKFFDGEVANE